MKNTLKNTSVCNSHGTEILLDELSLSLSLFEADDDQNTATIAHGVDYVSQSWIAIEPRSCCVYTRCTRVVLPGPHVLEGLALARSRSGEHDAGTRFQRLPLDADSRSAPTRNDQRAPTERPYAEALWFNGEYIIARRGISCNNTVLYDIVLCLSRVPRSVIIRQSRKPNQQLATITVHTHTHTHVGKMCKYRFDLAWSFLLFKIRILSKLWFQVL